MQWGNTFYSSFLACPFMAPRHGSETRTWHLETRRQVVNNSLSNLNGTMSSSTLKRNDMYRAFVNAE